MAEPPNQFQAFITASQQQLQAMTEMFTQQTAAMTQLVQRLNEAGNGAAAQGAPFYASPMEALPTDSVIDYSSKAGKKFHALGTAALLTDGFDVEPDMLVTLATKLEKRAKDLKLTEPGGIAMVSKDPDHPDEGEKINIIKDYGLATYEQIKKQEVRLLPANNRHTQMSKLLYDMLWNSLSETGIKRIQTWKSQFDLTIPVQVGEELVHHEYNSGPCLWKVIVRESHLDTTTTASAIRLQLSSLDDYINTHGQDIVAFNSHVRDLLDGLSARGEHSLDTMVNLFKGYHQVTDPKFTNYVQGLENEHEAGDRVLDPNSLMIKTSNYYKKRLMEVNDPWCAPDPKAEQIKALQAQLTSISKKVQKGGKDGGTKVTFKPGTKPGAPLDNQQKPEKPGWLKNNEKPGDLTKPRTWNKQTWWWCDPTTGGKCNGHWRIHKPEECKGMAKRSKDSDEGPSNKKAKKGSKKDRLARAKKAIAAQQALMAQINQESSDEESEE
jgi:hypothetical protein